MRKKHSHHALLLSTVFWSWEFCREDMVPGFYLSLLLENFLDIFKGPKSVTGYPLPQEQWKLSNMACKIPGIPWPASSNSPIPAPHCSVSHALFRSHIERSWCGKQAVLCLCLWFWTCILLFPGIPFNPLPIWRMPSLRSSFSSFHGHLCSEAFSHSGPIFLFSAFCHETMVAFFVSLQGLVNMTLR